MYKFIKHRIYPLHPWFINTTQRCTMVFLLVFSLIHFSFQIDVLPINWLLLDLAMRQYLAHSPRGCVPDKHLYRQVLNAPRLLALHKSISDAKNNMVLILIIWFLSYTYVLYPQGLLVLIHLCIYIEILIIHNPIYSRIIKSLR